MAKNKVSITYTALIWAGILLALFGAIVTVMGLGGSIVFEGSVGDIKVKTTQTGLAILVVGAVLSGAIALKLPKGIVVLEKGEKYSFTEKLARRIPILSIVMGIVAIILLVLSFLCGGFSL